MQVSAGAAGLGLMLGGLLGNVVVHVWLQGQPHVWEEGAEVFENTFF